MTLAYEQVIETLTGMGLPPGSYVCATEVYLTRVLERICGSPLEFPARYPMAILLSDPSGVIQFTFRPPVTASPDGFNKVIEEWLKDADRQIRKKYLERVLGRRPGKLSETIERNALWLYENRVESRSIKAIARELGNENRRGEVKDALSAVAADLTPSAGG